MSTPNFANRRFRDLANEMLDDSDDVFAHEGPGFFEAAGNWCKQPDATLVTSLISIGDPHPMSLHMPVIDIDLPCAWVPSTNEHHGHLYINQVVTFDGLVEILEVLEKHGIVQSGYRAAAEARGYSAVRVPGLKKPAKA